MPDFHDFYINVVGLQRAKISGTQILSLCPITEHTKKNPCFSANTDTGQCFCFKGCIDRGNAYTLAQRLNIDNPEQWLSNRKYKPVEYIPTNTMKNNAKTKKQKQKYTDEQLMNFALQCIENLNKNMLIAQSIPDGHGDLIGLNDDGIETFHYFADDKCIGIKRHKDKDGNCMWVGDGSCKIFKQQFIQDFDDTIYIVEGERDAIFAPFNAISFSSGAGSIPNDLSPIYVRNSVCIIYDNDEAGRDGADKLARRIKMDKPEIEVKIAQWGDDLPDGYDVYDDYLSTQLIDKYNFDRLNAAIDNAIDFELTLPGKIGDFTIMTGSHMEDTTPPPVEWLIENVLPKHFNSIIAGTTGSKKSYWALQLALSLANGEREFCGNKIVNSSGIKVLYIDTECDKDEIHRRFKRIINHMDNWSSNENITVMAKGGRHVDIWKDVHEIVQITNPELIIFDSLYNSTSVNDFSKSPQMSRVTNELSEFKVRYGVTVLGIGHFNKGNHEVGLMLDRMSGASALQNWIEFAMLMTMTNRENFNIWRVAKTRGVPFIPTMYGLEWNDFWFTTRGIVDDINPFLITTESKLKWKNVLEDCPRRFDTSQWLNVYNQKFKMSERTGREWLRKCLSSRMIKKVTHGIYEKNLGIIDEHNIDK